MKSGNLVELLPRDNSWCAANEEEALCHLAALTSPVDRAAEAVTGLLKRFGRPADIIRAQKCELTKVTGVCEDMANTFNSVHTIFLGLLWQQLQNSNSAHCKFQISNWCREQLRSENSDAFLAVLYSHGDFCGTTPYTVGTKGSVKVYTREVLKYALRAYATSIVVVFSRKHGDSDMNDEEFRSIEELKCVSAHLGIEVSDVIVLAER